MRGKIVNLCIGFMNIAIAVLLMVYTINVPQDKTLMTVQENTVVGYIVFWLKEEKRGHIISLAVDKKYRGRKIATQLLTKVVIIFKGVEANKITLEVRGDNSGAIEFYKKFGFLIDRKVPNYYEDGQEAYVMYFDKLVTN